MAGLPTDLPGFPPAPPSSRRLRLLLVEKDEMMGVALTKVLSSHHEVEIVPDGFAAALHARNRPPDLVIIDLYLPGTDNLSLIRPLRADPRTVGIPIIILAAPMHRELLLRCLNAGASNFLLKPFGLAELLKCVRTDLRLRSPAGESSEWPHPAFDEPDPAGTRAIPPDTTLHE